MEPHLESSHPSKLTEALPLTNEDLGILPIANFDSVQRWPRDGNDLVIVLVGGETLRIQEFFKTTGIERDVASNIHQADADATESASSLASLEEMFGDRHSGAVREDIELPAAAKVSPSGYPIGLVLPLSLGALALAVSGGDSESPSSLPTGFEPEYSAPTSPEPSGQSTYSNTPADSSPLSLPNSGTDAKAPTQQGTSSDNSEVTGPETASAPQGTDEQDASSKTSAVQIPANQETSSDDSTGQDTREQGNGGAEDTEDASSEWDEANQDAANGDSSEHGTNKQGSSGGDSSSEASDEQVSPARTPLAAERLDKALPSYMPLEKRATPAQPPNRMRTRRRQPAAVLHSANRETMVSWQIRKVLEAVQWLSHHSKTLYLLCQSLPGHLH